MTLADDIIVVGKITGVFGVKGWVKLYSWTEPRDGIGDYNPWLLRQGSKDWRSVKIEAARDQAKTVIAKIEGVDDRDAAQLLSGSEIGIYQSQLEALQHNEFFWRDLIGLRVLGKQGVLLGEVDSFLETGANDVLVVKGEQQYLIPWVMAQTIISIDLDKGEILVDWDAAWSEGAE
jgi:16S rRNA processing protein RimM